MAPHSSTLAWKIQWTEEPGRLQSMGLLRVGLDFHFSLSCIGEGNGNPLQCSCPENPRDGGAWWAAVYGVTQSWTRLKRLSSSSSSRGALAHSRCCIWSNCSGHRMLHGAMKKLRKKLSRKLMSHVFLPINIIAILFNDLGHTMSV